MPRRSSPALRKRSPIRQRDPLLRQLMVLVDRSGFTYAEAADRAGVDRHTLFNIRGGHKANAEIGTVAAIAGAVGCKLVLVKEDSGGKA